MKNYIGISRDHSGSMNGIATPAMIDYNSKIQVIKEATLANGQDTIVSVVEADGTVRRVVSNSNVTALQPITTYRCGGMTPLYDSVGDLIEQFEATPDAKDPNVSFLVMAITDGHENASRKWTARRLADKIRDLTMTDRWTFVFRVPRGYGHDLVHNLGLPEGNILEWDQTTRGVEAAAKRDAEAFTAYFGDRSTGMTSTKKFYSDLSKVSSKDVASVMTDISQEVMIFPVSANDNQALIRPFIEARIAGKMKRGASFYQLTKTEPVVQANKKILIRDKKTQSIYVGDAARQMLGLPTYGNIRLAPGNHGDFDIFIQSTSVNRKLAAGTNLIYWANAA